MANNIPRYTILYGIRKENGIVIKNNYTQLFFERYKLPVDCFNDVLTTDELYMALQRVFSSKKNTQIWKVLPFTNESNKDQANINIERSIFKDALERKGFNVIQEQKSEDDIEDSTELTEEDREVFKMDLQNAKNAREYYIQTAKMYKNKAKQLEEDIEEMDEQAEDYKEKKRNEMIEARKRFKESATLEKLNEEILEKRAELNWIRANVDSEKAKLDEIVKIRKDIYSLKKFSKSLSEEWTKTFELYNKARPMYEQAKFIEINDRITKQLNTNNELINE